MRSVFNVMRSLFNTVPLTPQQRAPLPLTPARLTPERATLVPLTPLRTPARFTWVPLYPVRLTMVRHLLVAGSLVALYPFAILAAPPPPDHFASGGSPMGPGRGPGGGPDFD